MRFMQLYYSIPILTFNHTKLESTLEKSRSARPMSCFSDVLIIVVLNFILASVFIRSMF